MYKIRLLLLFIGISSISFSQTEEKTNVNRDIDIVKVYTQVVKEGYGTPQVYKELANACYFKSDYKASIKWFEKFFETEKNIDETLLYRYKQSLKAMGLYSESNVFLAVGSTN